MHPLDRLLRVILPATAALVVSALLIVGLTNQPNRLQVGFAPEQPIPFSHKVHVGDNKMECQYCHVGADKGRYAGVPPLETCMNCHRVTKAGSDVIRELTRKYEEGEPVNWKRIHNLPDHVYFDHRPHVRSGIACQVCHGDVGSYEIQQQFMSLRMGTCLDCHRDSHSFIEDPRYRLPVDPELKGAESCSACHR